MSLASLEPVSPWSAAELAGPLNVQIGLAAFSWAELVEVARSLRDTATAAHFALADTLVAALARSGAKPSERGRALQEFCTEAGLDLWDARIHLRAAVLYPPEERERYPQLSWGHFREIITRSALPGDTEDARAERVRQFSEEAADRGLSVNETKRLIRETLHPEPEEEEAAPAPTEAPPVEDGDLLARVRREERERCARAICLRCEWGHAVGPPGFDGYSEWMHGTDETPGGITAGPETCQAGPIWGLP